MIEKEQIKPRYNLMVDRTYFNIITSEQPNLLVFSGIECKQIITQLLWPRLVALRIKQVLSALLPLCHFKANGKFNILTNQLSYAINLFGWILHGLRFLINTLHILLEAIPGQWVCDADKQLTWQIRFERQFNRTWIECGSDLIWIFSTLAPDTLSYTMGFFLVDLLWTGYRAWIQVNHLTDKNRTHEEKKVFLSLCQLIEINSIIIIKNFILPVCWPSLAIHPVFSLMCALLILSSTLMHHVLNQYLEKYKPSELIEDPINTRQILIESPATFFKRPTSKRIKKDNLIDPLHDIHMLTL